MAAGVEGRTFEQPLDLAQLAGIIQLAKLLCLLRQILPLDGRVTLVGDNLGGGVVEVGHEGGEVEG